jgi:hypothetical protein
MATFLTRREAQQRAKDDRAEKRKEKLYFSDLLWAAKRRYLTEKEWYDLHKLNEVYGSWGPERSEYELGVLSEMREFFGRHQVGSKCPHLNALEKHLANHAEVTQREEKVASKKIVKAHPTEKLAARKSK